MPLGIQSKVFEKLRASDKTPAGLTGEQLQQITALIARSPTLTARMDDFEAHNGCLCYSESETNYYTTIGRELPAEQRMPCICLNPSMYANGTEGAEANIESLVEVLAHETSHYLTYFKERLNPNECKTCDDAGAAGSFDEARAYATEYVVQREINRTGEPHVDWMKEGQLEAIQPRVERLPANATSEEILTAATCALIEWAANWTGPDRSKGGYFQYYRNAWLTSDQKPTQSVELDSVKVTLDSDGNIAKVSFTCAGAMVVADIGRFGTTTALA